MRDILIVKEPVELYKILKFEGLVGSGAEAKAAIDAGVVRVNNDIELRRRRKIVAGDVIEFDGEVMRTVLES